MSCKEKFFGKVVFFFGKVGGKLPRKLCKTFFLYKAFAAVSCFGTTCVSLWKNFTGFSTGEVCQLSLTALVSSSISMEKAGEAMIFFSTVSIEEMMVVWLRLRILPMPGKDMSVIRRIR